MLSNLSVNNQKSSVPIHLLHLLGLILEECKQYDKVSNSTEDMVVKLAQLIKFNAVKCPRRNNASEKKRHSKQNEPLLPLLIGLSIHSQTRKKGIAEFLASQGLSVSYNRVIEIEDDITKQLCFHYNSQGVVFPPTLKDGLFTVAAIENIDHGPSSSTSQTSFHGTSISIFQSLKKTRSCRNSKWILLFLRVKFPWNYQYHTPAFCQLRMLNLSLLIKKNTKSILTLVVHRTELKNGLQISNNWISGVMAMIMIEFQLHFFFVEKSCHKMP